MSALDEAQIPVREGDVLAGKFKVEKVLGSGGMGVVVAARHLELRQRVALKFLLPSALGSAEHVERFLREAQAVVRLKSDHVAKVLDIGRLEDGAPYIVMEYLDGSDLSQYLFKQGPLPVEEAVGYVLQACEALAEAHALGIIHRDMKPQNLFLTRMPDGSAHVKVLDFGISKTISATSQAPLSLTRTSTIIGSPLYMSPEQMRSAKSATERSDLWSLGVILYELLTGRVPFLADTMPDLCFKVAQDAIVPPIELRKEIPQALSDAILRCLHRDVAGRMPNVAELAGALEPFLPAAQRGAAGRISAVLHLPSSPPSLSEATSPAFAPLKPAPVGAATGGSGWGTTQSHAVGRGRKMAIAGAGVAALAVAVTLTFIAVRGSDAGSAHATPASSVAPPSTFATAAPSPLPVTPPPTPSVIPLPTETSSAVAANPAASAKPPLHAAAATLPFLPPKATAKPTPSGPPRAWE